MIINSSLKVLREKMPAFDEGTVKNEPMLFNCNMLAAEILGGPMTRAFLQRLPKDWQDADLVIDSRVHMLMPGWYPCIPGWHHDDVPRTRKDGQPNYKSGQNRSQHIFTLINADICPTAFAVGTAKFEEPPLNSVIYEQWHKKVEELIAQGKLEKIPMGDRLLVQFDDRTWHTGTKAVKNGWRFFIRASRYFTADGVPTSRGNPRTNELRRQVQVYMDNPNAGW